MVGAFKEMDPKLAQKLIEGIEDELAPEARAQDALYAQFRCPRGCGVLQREHDPRHAFSGDTLVARALLRCPNCRYLVDPHTNIVLESGSPAKMPQAVARTT